MVSQRIPSSPRRSKGPPRDPQGTPRGLPRHPKGPPKTPKGHPRTRGGPPRTPKDPQRTPKDSQRTFKEHKKKTTDLPRPTKVFEDSTQTSPRDCERSWRQRRSLQIRRTVLRCMGVLDISFDLPTIGVLPLLPHCRRTCRQALHRLHRRLPGLPPRPLQTIRFVSTRCSFPKNILLEHRTCMSRFCASVDNATSPTATRNSSIPEHLDRSHSCYLHGLPQWSWPHYGRHTVVRNIEAGRCEELCSTSKPSV